MQRVSFHDLLIYGRGTWCRPLCWQSDFQSRLCLNVFLGRVLPLLKLEYAELGVIQPDEEQHDDYFESTPELDGFYMLRNGRYDLRRYKTQ